ncbi:MAG: hypothetical protein JNM90_08790, partial [Burkholderiales bacterium]|nr:hypothetical protein [Burkholderiales bacterium]
RVTVPAGAFECFRVEGKGISRQAFGPGSTTLLHNYWVAPGECRRPIRVETERVAYGRRGLTVLEDERLELVSFRQG